MRTITLELLRHGPAHNQLLSPLTQYLALCENHSAVTVQVPFEHNQFLHRLRALSYRLKNESRRFQLRDTAAVLGTMLAEIPGLTADVNRGECGAAEEPIMHLRLVLSASELGLLPFELAVAPNGFPGAGQPLLLQSQRPLCITRETRRASDDFVEWPHRPRILFVTASPPGYKPVPIEAHLLTLRQAFDPWIRTAGDDSPEARRAAIGKHIVVLPNASIDAIQNACAEGKFTHIHILAHGVEYQKGYDVRFGLALHSAANPDAIDIVDGERLATAIRVTAQGANGKLCRPAVVSLASCEGGNGGSVAGAGASVAHALHEAGVPMVIASQFPLTFGASVVLAQVLYEGLLWGEDPRKLLVDLRRRLHTEFPDSHDWASLIAYASLPPNFERQLASVQIDRAQQSIDVALRVTDEALRRFSKSQTTRTPSEQADEKHDAANRDALQTAYKDLGAAKARLQQILERYKDERARIDGLLGSAEKREAEVLYTQSTLSGLGPNEQSSTRAKAIEALDRAREYYWKAYDLDRGKHWSLVQYLSLTLILDRHPGKRGSESISGLSTAALWTTAHAQSVIDLRSLDLLTRNWAAGNLVELYCLVPMIPGLDPGLDQQTLEKLAVEHAKTLVLGAGPRSFEAFSTRRQLARYLDWYRPLLGDSVIRTTSIAEAAFSQFPESEEPDWTA